ncbi:hypothetical protein NIB75_15710 [Bacteroides uniformis]|nr:hypothetical protein [Bacteroides uniformis]
MSDQRNIWAYTNDATEDNTGGFRYQYVINHNFEMGRKQFRRNFIRQQA